MTISGVALELIAGGALLGLVCMLVGYLWGKSVGRTAGMALGRTEATILLKERALEEGHCPLCGSRAGDSDPQVAVPTRVDPASSTDQSGSQLSLS